MREAKLYNAGLISKQEVQKAVEAYNMAHDTRTAILRHFSDKGRDQIIIEVVKH
jgi:hypothetical protein